MFLKPYKVKSKSVLKGSDRKRLKAMVLAQMNMSEDDIGLLMKSKESVSQMKILTHKGIQLNVYFFDKNPVFIELEQKLFPTVYTLWKLPNLVPAFTIWPVVFDRLSGGADLMLPGVVLRSEDATCERLQSLKTDDVCSIKLVGNLAPVAVGRSLVNGGGIFVDGIKKGKAAEVLHIYGDLLWEQGNKTSPPVIPEADDNSVTTEKENEGESGSELNFDSVSIDKCDETTLKPTEVKEELDSNLQCVESTENTILELETEVSNVSISDGCNDDEPIDNIGNAVEEETTIKTSVEEMDDLLWKCLLVALKTNAKKVELPCLTSTFYRKHILASCPQAKNMDIRKTSYKKLSNFLKAAEKEGILEVKELSKGVESVTGINYGHDRIKQLKLKPEDIENVTETPEAATIEEQFSSPPVIRELYTVSAAVAPLFSAINIKKGTPLSAKEVRDNLTEYVKLNELQDPGNKKLVKLDPVLSQCLARKDDVDALSWEELHRRCFSKMQPAYEITFPGKAPVIKKGAIEPIEISVAQRAANKKVTLINNLDKYGIDPNKFAHQLQTGVAASTSVATNFEKKCQQVLVQGNQVKFVAKLLLDNYHIQRKYIIGLENIAKKK